MSFSDRTYGSAQSGGVPRKLALARTRVNPLEFGGSGTRIFLEQGANDAVNASDPVHNSEQMRMKLMQKAKN